MVCSSVLLNHCNEIFHQEVRLKNRKFYTIARPDVRIRIRRNVIRISTRQTAIRTVIRITANIQTTGFSCLVILFQIIALTARFQRNSAWKCIALCNIFNYIFDFSTICEEFFRFTIWIIGVKFDFHDET